MSTLKEKIDRGEFVITAEIVPPLAAAPEKLLAEAAHLRCSMYRQYWQVTQHLQTYNFVQG